MTDHAQPQLLRPDQVTAVRHEPTGGWLVGLVFTSKEAGEPCMRAIIDLYNTVASLPPRDRT